MDYTKLTLGTLLSSTDETVRRNAVSILKVLQKKKPDAVIHECTDGKSTHRLHADGGETIEEK